MIFAARHATALLVAMAVATVSSAAQAQSQSCPAPLKDARHLVLVTAKTMSDMSAEMRLYERASPCEPWRAASQPEPANLGRVGRDAGNSRQRRDGWVAFLPPLRTCRRAAQT